MADNSISFADFTNEWFNSVTEGSPATVELGRRFAQKLVSQWLDASESTTEFIYCDGSGDGGIDVAVLDTGPDESNEEPEESGHTWYLVQSKYGSAFAGPSTIMVEGQKIVDTLDGRRERLNSLVEGLLERLKNFRNSAGAFDRIVVVLGTQEPLDEAGKRALDDLRSVGRSRLGAIFDVEAISVRTIYDRLQEELESEAERLMLSMNADLVASGPDLLVGSISLPQLYGFLKSYRAATGDLDQIYEKNVRRFLGSRGKVNRAMQGTLRDAPERFGLYNNGITIVVQDFRLQDGAAELIEPYIVNGCQTTRTIWEVFHQRVDSGGTGLNPEMEAWKEKVNQGVVVTKIVKTGQGGEPMLQAITRYTNTQNAIREKDFLALTGDFRTWQAELGDRFVVYLEIQRGGWDSQRALQNNNPNRKQFTRSANAADLVKVFGAGWLREAGLAFGKNPPFLPDGSVFKRIVNNVDDDAGGAFGVLDLYAAYLLEDAADDIGFGRGAKQTRRQTRFLFYMVAVDLLKDALSRGQVDASLRGLSRGMIATLEDADAKAALLDSAVEVIDGYMTPGTDNNIFDEPAFVTFNNDLNAFLKWEQLGKSEDSSPRLRTALAIAKQVMGMAHAGRSRRDFVVAAAKGCNL